MHKSKTFLILGAIISVLLLFNIYLIIQNNNLKNSIPTDRNGKNSTANGVYVILKEKNPRKITVRDKDSEKNEYKNFDIFIENENVWNLIEENQMYFVAYSQGKDNNLYLDQIEIMKDYIE